MGGAIFQYGTAVHLALLTVAPLFLSAFCGPSAHATALMWLSAFGALWVLMNPSPRAGEWPRDARHRIGWEIFRDPFFTLCAVALVLSAIRAVNDGIALSYNASSRVWFLKEPAVPQLPGAVPGAGFVPLAGVLGVTVVALGVRHALGARARLAYLLSCGLLAALAVACWWGAGRCGAAIPRLTPSPADPFHPGSLLGVCFLMAVAALAESWRVDNAVLELLSSGSVAVLLTGLILHAPTFSLWVFALGGVLIAGVAISLLVLRGQSAGWFGKALSLLFALTPVGLALAGEIPAPSLWPLFPDGFMSLREAASTAALEAWKSSTRLGLGLGTYPLAFGFFVRPEDWQILSSAQTAAPNGGIHFLFERGFLGCAVLLAGFGILLRDGILRYLRAGSDWCLGAPHLLGPLVLLLVAAVLFFECTFAEVEALMPVVAAWGLTVASFPEFSEADHG